MNILIITPFYKQDRNIASVRWTNIAQRLSKKHNVIIVTQPLDNDMDMTFYKQKEDGILVARINQKTTYEKIAVRYFHGATGDDWQTASSSDSSVNSTTNSKESAIRILKNRIMFASMKSKARAYALEIKRQVIPKGMKIDIVISSACPFIEMMFGYEVKKVLGCKWISDFRDLPFTKDVSDLTHQMKNTMKKELVQADIVNTIAFKGKEFLLSNDIVSPSEKITTITNGFSMNDMRDCSTIDDGKLHIVHTGSMYGGARKPDLLFKAIQRVRELDKRFAYVLECAGGNNSQFINSAKKYNETDCVIDRGFVTREEALNMQASADCLLSLVIDRPGSLAAKLFEYMLNKKPVINITCGDAVESEETLFVRQLNIGIAVEESEGSEAVEKLSEFLLKQWIRKCTGTPLEYNPDSEAIAQFDHDVISKKIEELVRRLSYENIHYSSMVSSR